MTLRGNESEAEFRSSLAWPINSRGPIASIRDRVGRADLATACSNLLLLGTPGLCLREGQGIPHSPAHHEVARVGSVAPREEGPGGPRRPKVGQTSLQKSELR